MAVTTVSVLTQEFENVLLSKMILKPDDPYFIANAQLGLISDNTAVLGGAVVPPGTVFKIDQPAFVAATTTYTESSRRLTEGTAINTTALSLSESQYSVTMREYGGPYDTSNTRVAPVTITEFLRRRALHDQAEYVATRLKRDYMRFAERTVIDLALASTNVTTADGTAEASITSGKAMAYANIAGIVKSLKNRGVQPFPNGRYRAVLDAKNEYDLKVDATLQKAWQFLPDGGAILAGYIGTAGGVDFFTSTVIPTSGVGSGSAVTGYQGFFWGDAQGIGPLLHLIGMAPEPRRNTNDDFGRQDAYVWVSHEGFAASDYAFIERFTST